jgi:hypothetical protein
MSWLSEIAPDPANVTLFAAVVGGLPGSKNPFQASPAADYIQKLSKAEQQLPHWQRCRGLIIIGAIHGTFQPQSLFWCTHKGLF